MVAGVVVFVVAISLLYVQHAGTSVPPMEASPSHAATLSLPTASTSPQQPLSSQPAPISPTASSQQHSQAVEPDNAEPCAQPALGLQPVEPAIPVGVVVCHGSKILLSKRIDPYTSGLRGRTLILDPPLDQLSTTAYIWNRRNQRDATPWQPALPGYPSAGAVYVLGHTCHISGCSGAFDALQSVRTGDLVTLTTPTGQLTYRAVWWHVYNFESVNYQAIFSRGHEPGKLWLFTCLLPDGGDKSAGKSQTQNFAVELELIGARRG